MKEDRTHSMLNIVNDTPAVYINGISLSKSDHEGEYLDLFLVESYPTMDVACRGRYVVQRKRLLKMVKDLNGWLEEGEV